MNALEKWLVSIKLSRRVCLNLVNIIKKYCWCAPMEEPPQHIIRYSLYPNKHRSFTATSKSGSVSWDASQKRTKIGDDTAPKVKHLITWLSGKETVVLKYFGAGGINLRKKQFGHRNHCQLPSFNSPKQDIRLYSPGNQVFVVILQIIEYIGWKAYSPDATLNITTQSGWQWSTDA